MIVLCYYSSLVVATSSDRVWSFNLISVLISISLIVLPFQGIIIDLILDAMAQFRHSDVEGFFITGFPRDIVQAQGFEERVRNSSKLAVQRFSADLRLDFADRLAPLMTDWVGSNRGWLDPRFALDVCCGCDWVRAFWRARSIRINWGRTYPFGMIIIHQKY